MHPLRKETVEEIDPAGIPEKTPALPMTESA